MGRLAVAGAAVWRSASLMPISTPEPGGMSSNQVLTLLEELADLPFVGMDCVEVAPPYDHAELTSMAAANFVVTYLAGRIAAKRG